MRESFGIAAPGRRFGPVLFRSGGCGVGFLVRNLADTAVCFPIRLGCPHRLRAGGRSRHQTALVGWGSDEQT
jgi:hypothetical protein